MENSITRIEAQDARVGDYVLFKGGWCGWMTVGKVYEIKEIDEFGDPVVIDDAGDHFIAHGVDLDYYTEKPVEARHDRT